MSAPPEELAEILRLMLELKDRSRSALLRSKGAEGEQAVREAVPFVRDLRVALTELKSESEKAKSNAMAHLSMTERKYERHRENVARSLQEIDREVEDLKSRFRSKAHRVRLEKFRKGLKERLRVTLRHIEEQERIARKMAELDIKVLANHSMFATMMLAWLDALGKGMVPRRRLAVKGFLALAGLAAGVFDFWLGAAFTLAELLKEAIKPPPVEEVDRFIAKLENKIEEFRFLSHFLPDLTATVKTISRSVSTSRAGQTATEQVPF